MSRVQKNAEGEDVRVDTPDFGCIVIEAAAPAKTKAKPATSEAEAASEGAE